MVRTFMEGIDPQYKSTLERALQKFFEDYSGFFASQARGLSAPTRTKYANMLKKVGKDLFVDFSEKLKKYRREVHVHPVLETVAALSKDDLAAMAESFVHLTSLKRKVSLDTETVGGPVDVAVISKGDGFVWIKRKHYFKPELNHHFFANYYAKFGQRPK